MNPTKRRTRSALALFVAGCLSAAGGVALSSSEGSSASAAPQIDPREPWVRADGTLDAAKAPATVRVAAFDGSPLKDARGLEVTTPLRENLVNPDPARADREARRIRALQIADAHQRGLEIPGVVRVVDAATGEDLPVDPMFRPGGGG